MNCEDCFNKGLLKEGKKDPLKAEKALEIAKKKIKEARSLKENNFFSQAITESYTAMFQAARSILFKKGIYEKSHYCVIQYLLEKTNLDKRLITWLDTYRTERHHNLYGLEDLKYKRSDATLAIKRGEEFIGEVTK
jgi:uncharacterized protein (UPF0332 family)